METYGCADEVRAEVCSVSQSIIISPASGMSAVSSGAFVSIRENGENIENYSKYLDFSKIIFIFAPKNI